MSTEKTGIGQVIFTSFKPIIKMAAVGGGGVIFARKGYLTPESCKANASLIMNLLLPLLIFSTVLPAFDSGNMESVLAVVITGSFYQVLGLSFGLIVRWLTPTPKSWKGGVLAAGAFSNLGDLVISYISTLAKSAPFDPDKDVAKGIAYASIFMVVQLTAIFNLGGLQLIKRDFDPRPEVLLDTVNLVSRLASARRKTPGVPGSRLSCELNQTMTSSSEGISPACEVPTTPAMPAATAAVLEGLGRPLSSSSPRHPDIQTTAATTTIPEIPNSQAPTIADSSSASPPTPTPISLRIWTALKPLLTPPSLSLVFSLVIANVPYLKALFVHTPTVPTTKIPNAPDDKPPLDFIMEIATFSGPCVPVLGMLLLGAALSRLSMNNLPKGFWKAAVLMALLKLVLGPIIGIAWTTQLKKRTNWIDPNDKILEFVMIISSGAPTATSNVYLTNIFAPLGEECLEMSALSA
ncbi:hypothetical protein L873DRAFT_1758966 [Choiromyces venosus 120613-1]|uniref:Auxin efflux carrier n=1 Tax=Choiromyces venosus 120613-1 TaxID=1336337 RepID=A0A3N4K5E5_9PEZI|nr:hypothetical protein L873DRAFT_1758966 [Choiromyces venosus 120613-1]